MDTDIQQFLLQEGFAGEAARRARRALEAEGLTRSGKQRLHVSKLDRARAALQTRFLRVCHRPACHVLDDPLERLEVAARHCQVCGGSANRRAGQLAREAMLEAGCRQLLVLGGTPATHAALVHALGESGIDVRCIDGTQGVRPLPTVEADLAWADLMVIWATTPLPHKVSSRYTSSVGAQPPTITVPRRGVEALCAELVRFCCRANGRKSWTQRTQNQPADTLAVRAAA